MHLLLWDIRARSPSDVSRLMDRSRTRFLLAPGAGAASSHPHVQTFARLLASVGSVEPFDYPYAKEGKKRPDPLPKLIGTHRAGLTSLHKTREETNRLAGEDRPRQYGLAKRAAQRPRARRPGALPVMLDPANFHAMEKLRDGRTVEIRAQRPQDREGIRAAIARTSTKTLYHRFFTVKRAFSEKEAHFFLDIDFVDHVALVALAEEDGKPTIVGGCRYIVARPGLAEVSFLVIDEYQAKGIGSALMRHIAAIGREAGLRELMAEVLSDNGPMLKVFARSGLAMNTMHEGSSIHVTLRYP